MSEENKVVLDPVSPSPKESVGSQSGSVPKWYSRFAANLIDGIILMIFSIPAFVVLGFFTGATVDNPKVTEFVASFLGLLISVLFSLYYAYFHSKNGATWGMNFIGINIYQTSGELLSFQNAFLRALIVSTVPGFLQLIPFIGPLLSLIFIIALAYTILSDKNSQGFHDKMYNAIYKVADEKTSRAKWVIGCYCGCLGPVIVLLIATVFTGMGVLLSNPNLLNSEMMKNPNLKMNEPEKSTKQIEKEPTMDYKKPSYDEGTNKINDTYNNKMDDSTVKQPSSNQDSTMGGQNGVFYKACMDANTNPNIDLSNYCSCAEKESRKTTDINLIVDRCKDQIRLK